MSKVVLVGDARCLRRLRAKNRVLSRSYVHLYQDSLYGFIKVVKEQLAKGKVEPHSYSHRYTLKLYKSTKAVSTVKPSPEGSVVDIRVGYLLPSNDDYGLNLETFVPRFVSIPELRKWAETKKIKPVPNLKYLQNKLKTKPNVYPILQDTWDVYADLYVEEVFSRVKDRWENA